MIVELLRKKTVGYIQSGSIRLTNFYIISYTIVTIANKTDRKIMDIVFYSQFWPGLASTIVGTLILATIFFLLKERIFELPSVDGIWECEQIVEKTAFNPYIGMKLWYRIVLLQEKEKIFGTGEKDRETAGSGNRTYSGKDRIPIEINGRIDKLITRSDIIKIHWTENGMTRKSSTIHKLRISGSKTKGKLFGTFYSTAGKCEGHVTWTRVS